MIKIINNTDFFYKEIGELIDNISWDYREETNYVGKIDLIRIRYKRQKVKIQIRYMKKYVEWRFDFDEQN